MRGLRLRDVEPGLAGRCGIPAAVTSFYACTTSQPTVGFIAKEPICPASILDWIRTIT
jgi:hypothetical protein